MDTSNINIDLESYWRSTSKFSLVSMYPELPLPAKKMFISIDDIEVISEDLQRLLRKKLNGNMYKEGDKFLIFYYGGNCMIKIEKIISDFSSSNNNNFMVETKTIFELFKGKSEDDNFQDMNYRTSEFGGYEEILNKIKSFTRCNNVDMNSLKKDGIIIYGTIGSGKTSLLHKIANDSQAYKIFIKGCELISKFYGEAENKLKELLTKAKKMSPSIIMIDDIELLCPKNPNTDTYIYRSILSTLCSFFDSLDNITPIMVLATTSEIDQIHPTLRQSGRFNEEFELEIPKPDTRYQILKAILKCTPSLSEEDLKKISQITHGFVAGDLKSLCTKAIIHADENSNCSDIRINDLEYALQFVKPNAMNENEIPIPNVKWTDIGGHQELKKTFERAIIWPWKHPDGLLRLGLKPPKGILMFGPPGCSKTMIAKAIATESKLNFISIKCSDLFSKWLGDSERAVRELFERAKQVAPSIVFLDELDALARQRSFSNKGGSNVEESVTSQLLTVIDGCESLNDVIVIGATNRPDLIDSALLRPGRIDKIVYVPLPDDNTRKEIFMIRFKRIPVTTEVLANLDELVNLTKGFSGAEIDNICQQAGIEAIEENSDVSSIDLRHFHQVLKSVTAKTPRYLNDIYLNFLNEKKSMKI